MADTINSPTHAIANPGPLGLVAFGMTTLLLALHNLGLFGIDSVILTMGICIGGAAQIIAGIFEFKRGNTFGATAFTCFGLFWWSFVLINTTMISGMATAGSESLGAYFLVWAVFTAFMFVATLRKHKALQVVFITLVLLFLTVALKDITGMEILGTVAGVIGFICGGSAMYTAFGELYIEDTGEEILPLG